MAIGCPSGARASTARFTERFALMETRLTLGPGQNSTRKLVARFGKRLVRVRYRYDAEQRKRYTTVELIVAESRLDTPRARAAGNAPGSASMTGVVGR